MAAALQQDGALPLNQTGETHVWAAWIRANFYIPDEKGGQLQITTISAKLRGQIEPERTQITGKKSTKQQTTIHPVPDSLRNIRNGSKLQSWRTQRPQITHTCY